MTDIRKKFWAESKKLIEGCNDKELGVLRSMINKAIEENLIKSESKYLSGKKHKAIK